MEDTRSSVGPWAFSTSSKTPKGAFLQGIIAETVIHEGVCITGKIQFQNSLRIDGTFEGELCSEGSLHIGPTGVVRSDLSLKSVIVEGFVEGNISVKDKLEICATAEVKGDITAGVLKVEEGAKLTGIVSVGSRVECSVL